MSSVETLRQWIAAINDHDVTRIAALMTPDSVFVDSLGNRVESARTIEAGWRSYFAMCPDYWTPVATSITEGDTTLISGEAGGTMDGETWRIPAAWKAVIRDGLMLEWRVFADNKPVYEILARRRH
jgi:ketosteroid isomerase-like protein